MKGDQTTLDLFEDIKNSDTDQIGLLEDYESMSLNVENLDADVSVDFLTGVNDSILDGVSNNPSTEVVSIEIEETSTLDMKDIDDTADGLGEFLSEEITGSVAGGALLDVDISSERVTESMREELSSLNREEITRENETSEIGNMPTFNVDSQVTQSESVGQSFGNAQTFGGGPVLKSGIHDLDVKSEYGKVNIMAIGIGGAGSNAINRMYSSDFGNIKLVAMDTSQQTLDVISADYKLLLGESILHGHGSGNDVEKTVEAVRESEDEIRKLLTGIDMVFVTAGIGRGTGTSGIVEVGRIAKEMGILTIGFAILPSRIEADMSLIEKYYNSFVDAVDSNIVIENDKVNRVAADLPIAEARKIADQMLVDGIKGISDLIINPGKINLDYADIKTAFQNQGACVMGIGYGENEDAVVKAIQNSINEEIVDPESVATAQTIIFNITCARNTITIRDAAEGTDLIYQNNNGSSVKHMLFGYSYDESLEGRVKVTFIATGTKSIDFDDYREQTIGSGGIFGSVGRNTAGDIFTSIGGSDDTGKKPDFFN